MEPLNNPLEVGIRVLVVLCEVFPDSLDLGQLVYYDHAMLHSGDLDGPPSLHPATPARPGELGIKRELIADGLQVLSRAGMAQLLVTPNGIAYHASEDAPGFLKILEAPYVSRLQDRAAWVAAELHPLCGDDLRQAMTRVFDKWSEEFYESPRHRGPEGEDGE
ncbi:ABC-three component system middle component 2 [Streptomyces sp. NPDC002486]